METIFYVLAAVAVIGLMAYYLTQQKKGVSVEKKEEVSEPRPPEAPEVPTEREE